MPLSNPEDAIKARFKRVLKRSRQPDQKETSPQDPSCECTDKPGGDVAQIIEISDDNNTLIAKAEVVEVNEPKTKSLDAKTSKNKVNEAILPSPSASFLSVDSRQKDLDEQSKSSTDSAGSYLSEELQESDKNIPKLGNEDQKLLEEPTDKININTIVNQVIKAVSVDNERVKIQTNNKSSERRNGQVGDRRRNTWLPCTCPQYKVSCELATKCNAQAIFFAKMMVVKVIQLFIINLVIFSVGYNRDSTLQFIQLSHDWAYLAFGVFLVLLTCIRITMSYRARWPKYVALIGTLPLTVIIAFICTCVTVIYNSILIPLVTATVLLTFLMLTFTPYLLHKFVMHRITNFAGFGLTIVSSVVLLFLKELESKDLTYIQFVSHVWLPALLLSQLVVMVSILEAQRMLFGLSFNVSTKRWHIAALYL